MLYSLLCSLALAYLTQLTIFEEYLVESLNNNQIGFELSLDNLERALISGKLAQEITTRLTKKNNMAYLSFHIEIQVSFLQRRRYYFTLI